MLLLGVLVAPASARAQVAENPGEDAAVVRRFVEALNAEDLEGALATFSDDAVAYGRAGKDLIRARLERDFAVNRRMSITAVRVVGNRVTWWWQAFEDPDRQLGLPPIEGTDEAGVERGVIVANTGAVDPLSMQRREAAVASRAAQLKLQESGALRRLPSTQERGTPPTIPWAGAALLFLAITAGWAAVGRPPRGA